MLKNEIFKFCNLNSKLDIYGGDSDAVRVAILIMEMNVEEKRGKWRPRKRWIDIIENDTKISDVNKERSGGRELYGYYVGQDVRPMPYIVGSEGRMKRRRITE